jgi:hypothetical protein
MFTNIIIERNLLAFFGINIICNSYLPKKPKNKKIATSNPIKVFSVFKSLIVNFLEINFMTKFKPFKLIVLTSVLFFYCCTIGAQTRNKNDSIYLKTDFLKQECRSSLVFCGSFMHFQGKLNNNTTNYTSETMGYYSYPINPGFGIFYQYQIFKENYILAGINYQVCRIASTEFGILRFRYSEPGISVQLKHCFRRSGKIGLFSTIGLSGGQMKLFASESHGHIANWNDFGTKYLQNYSNDKLFVDIVFNTGVFFPSSQIEITPSLGYRVKDNWMSFYRHRFLYGFLINYQLKFSKK